MSNPPVPIPQQSNYTVALLGILQFQENKQENFNVLDIPVGFGQALILDINKTLAEISVAEGHATSTLLHFRKYIAL